MDAPSFIMVTAPAKINLYLGVHPHKDERGYHRVDTVMTAIDLADTLAIAPADELMVRTVPEAGFPMEENTAYRAAVAMGEAFDREAALPGQTEVQAVVAADYRVVHQFVEQEILVGVRKFFYETFHFLGQRLRSMILAALLPETEVIDPAAVGRDISLAIRH